MPSTTASPASARRVNGPRRELKIAIDREDLPWASSLVRMHPAGFQKTYPGRWINNVYFDSPSLENYEDNVAGISNRRKLRLARPQALKSRLSLDLRVAPFRILSPIIRVGDGV